MGLASSVRDRRGERRNAIGRLFEGQNLQGSEHGLDLSRETGRSFLRGAVAQLGSNNDAGRHLRFTDLSDPLRHIALRVTDHSDTMFVIEQVAHQSSTERGTHESRRSRGKSSLVGA